MLCWIEYSGLNVEMSKFVFPPAMNSMYSCNAF
jgi:hypothetical protein